MPILEYDYDKKIINAARKFKKCHTAAQYGTERETLDRVTQEAREAAEDQPAAPAWMDKAQQEDLSLSVMERITPSYSLSRQTCLKDLI